MVIWIKGYLVLYYKLLQLANNTSYLKCHSLKDNSSLDLYIVQL